MQKYKPPYLLRNGHVNTIYTSLFREPPSVNFTRERIETPDGDFLDLDMINSGNKRVAIICHGLEGSSQSKYVLGTSDILVSSGFDICAMNYRFCSGEINRTPQMYHSGWTPDLDEVIQLMTSRYDEIILVGYSLGGNLVLKYAGERGPTIQNKIKSVCGISVPLNLSSASMVMEQWENILYTKRFLKTLKKKIILKHEQFPSEFKLDYLSKIKTVKDFDDYYTGPLNGFENAEDYYAQCSSDQFLSSITVRTLIINAIDDPFLGMRCYPGSAVVGNDLISFIYPENGGHVGFYEKGDHTWNEKTIADFLTLQAINK